MSVKSFCKINDDTGWKKFMQSACGAANHCEINYPTFYPLSRKIKQHKVSDECRKLDSDLDFFILSVHVLTNRL